ncbi:MAG: helix-hairpin-helix domain-containing protein, partial [Sphingobacteriales bacterium]|nr:helix-hairpin-helix domain-containing protein [Sphingobacteriales bacterium]
MQGVAQIPDIPASVMEQQLESYTENNDDNTTEDDSFLQHLQQFTKTPVNLNTADERALKELVQLSDMQIQSLVAYRNFLGDLMDVYELQAVPLWDIGTINKLLPFITVGSAMNFSATFKERIKDGTHSLLVRVSQVPEKSKGYLVDTATTNNYYPGSAQKLVFRYKYIFKNLLQYGIVGEKDAGEQFFKGAQKQGFDFYSAHLFAKDIGIIKSLAIGDFTVNMGQGLLQWQSLAFKKSADVLNIKRQLPVLRPYNSAGEINFHRGAGITIAKRNIEATIFASYKKIDGNFVPDSVDYVSSLQMSGYHRTKSEVADKGIQQQLAFGGNITVNKNRFHIAVNGIQYQFKLPLVKGDDPYNKYALNGKSFGNYSIDYSYTYKNLHFFGEAATTNNFDKAFVNGLMINVDAKIDMSFLYRNISKKYQSLYSNAFTENTSPNNEKGLYGGISIRPGNSWRIDAYADIYEFAWLKYLVDAPSGGTDYLLQATYKPSKKLEIYVRYHTETKGKNYNINEASITTVTQQSKQNFRAQINCKLLSSLTFRNRVELLWFDKKGPAQENGFLSYIDFLYKPIMKKYAGSIRLQYFETDGYNSRLYAYENDVLYSFSIPVFYDKGF